MKSLFFYLTILLSAIQASYAAAPLASLSSEPSQPAACPIHAAFFAHAWGDEPDYTHHQQVVKIHGLLKKGHLRVWIDEERTTPWMLPLKAEFGTSDPNVIRLLQKSMRRGILSSEVIVFFITEAWLRKVTSGNIRDHCLFEFLIAKKYRRNFLLAVPMEKSCRDSTRWPQWIQDAFGKNVSTASFSTVNDEHPSFEREVNILYCEILLFQCQRLVHRLEIELLPFKYPDLDM